MRRSEMLQKLEGIVSMYRHIPWEISNQNLASIILNVIEHNGMIPPESEYWLKDISKNHRDPFCLNKWEPE